MTSPWMKNKFISNYINLNDQILHGVTSEKCPIFSTLRPTRNRRHFADDIFRYICLNENMWISIGISLKFVLKGPFNNIPSLVQIMAWRRPGDKPLAEPIVVWLPTHMCVNRSQWVNNPLLEQSIQYRIVGISLLTGCFEIPFFWKQLYKYAIIRATEVGIAHVGRVSANSWNKQYFMTCTLDRNFVVLQIYLDWVKPFRQEMFYRGTLHPNIYDRLQYSSKMKT